MNTFGHNLRLTTFGESHGPALGGIIDGFPAGMTVDFDFLQRQMARRRPGQSELTTSRNEADQVEFLSGLLDGVTTGTPIGFIIRNSNQHSSDYEEMRHTFRPSHADFTYQMRYGLRDHRGGGRASARETAVRVAAGALCLQWLGQQGIEILAYTRQVGPLVMPEMSQISREQVESNAVRCPNEVTAAEMAALIKEVKAQGDTIGGVIALEITGVKPGVGSPHFRRLNQVLASAMFSIPAVKGVEFGMGFEGCAHRGSEMLDPFATDPQGHIVTSSNHSGGIQGGISNGMPITLRIGFKPVATLLREVNTVDDNGRATTLKARGRHDPCVLPRAVPVVEAMAALTLADFLA